MSWERGMTAIEVLVVVTILLAAAIGGAATLTLHPAQHTTTLLALVGVVDRVHNEAAANGAAVQVSPHGSGSALAIVAAGATTYEGTTLEPLGLGVGDAVYPTFTLTVRPDGSFVPSAGATTLDCTAGVRLGILSGGAMAESYPLGCDDLHLPVSSVP